MIRRDEVYKIGILNKPHGVRGELLFTFTDDIFDRVEADYIVCLMDGILVPFYIEEYRFRTDTTALIKLEDVDTAEQARPSRRAASPTWRSTSPSTTPARPKRKAN